jgi:glutamyl-Q tRNA(Asp) synthetase
VHKSYVGRFAPSPTGTLHFGSLIAAVASFLQAKSQGGRWLVRIEDIDPPREVPGSAEKILGSLDHFGMKPDSPALYQSQRTDVYRKTVENLLRQGKAYWCGCTRQDLPASGIYPGTCRNGLAKGKTARTVRLRVNGASIRFTDLIQGVIEEHLDRTVGDFVIQRADGLPAYQLAVVLDDAYQGITEIVRGADLLDSSARQIHLQNCLGLKSPSYAHHPVAIDQEGRKLGKRFASDPMIDQPAMTAIGRALSFLGQTPPEATELDGLWSRAIEHWRLSDVPRVRQSLIQKASQTEQSFQA